MSDYYDKEWEQAWNADEEPQYFWIVHTRSHGRYIKYYKPSVAKLVEKRLRGIIYFYPVRPTV